MRRTLTVGLCLLLASTAFAQADTSPAIQGMKRAPVTGGELEYEIQGDGEPVLLVHGSHIADAFFPLMDQPVLARYRLIRYHRRGFAGSTKHDGPFGIERQAADALALLRHIGVERAHIVGHSYGGAIALQLALDAPDVVSSLVLLEPALTKVPSGAAFGKEVIAPTMKRYHAGDPDGAVDAFLRRVAGPNWRDDMARMVPGSPQQAERDARTFFEVEVPALEQWELGAKVKRISQPVLYVLAGDSHPMFTEGRDLVRSWFPESEDQVVQGVTHALQMQKPEPVAAVVGDFLRRHPIEDRRTTVADQRQ
jgi:pimeloyl-ACP methyl ester carboxylesterase